MRKVSHRKAIWFCTFANKFCDDGLLSRAKNSQRLTTSFCVCFFFCILGVVMYFIFGGVALCFNLDLYKYIYELQLKLEYFSFLFGNLFMRNSLCRLNHFNQA